MIEAVRSLAAAWPQYFGAVAEPIASELRPLGEAISGPMTNADFMEAEAALFHVEARLVDEVAQPCSDIAAWVNANVKK